MMNPLIFFSSALAFVSYIVYIHAIVKGKAKPHRTSRFVVLLITTLSTASLFAQGSIVAIWLSAIFMIGSCVVFLLSLRFGMGGREKTDIACLVIAVIGIIVWKQTANPVYALFASIGADFVGQIPMLIKTYRHPETEVWTFYFLDVLAALVSVLALTEVTVRESVFPMYIIFIDGLTIYFILRRRLIAF